MNRNSIRTWFKAMDVRLLPINMEQRFMQYIWLVYLPFFFGPVFYFSNQVSHWLYVTVSTIAFVFVYFRSYWAPRNQMFYFIVAIIIIATLNALYTVSALSLFIYAAAFCCRLPTQKQAFSLLAFILLWMAAISALFNLSANFYLPGVVFSLIIGLVNIYQFALHEKKKALILSQEEVQRLAKVAERERIARDLHDLIGHTFSVLTLKADLAGRLLDKDIEKARTEIQQIETISRDALSQVREVVSGYRSSDLLSELANAKHVFLSLDIDFDYQLEGLESSELDLDLHNTKELAIVLRELVTNIIKHANATRVTVLVQRDGEVLKLRVKDNGAGFEQTKIQGFGLLGIEERIKKLSGSVSVQSGKNDQGTLAIIGVPYIQGKVD